MGFFRRISTILGFAKDDAHAVVEEDEGKASDSAQRGPARGFSVQVPVAAEKPSLGPVIIPCSLGEGGVQCHPKRGASLFLIGLEEACFWLWYSRRLRIDEDGDVADEFLDEIVPPTSSGDQSRAAQPRFEVKYTTRPAPVRRQAINIDGNVHPCMEYQGTLRWV